jgi:hypothetical protein
MNPSSRPEWRLAGQRYMEVTKMPDRNGLMSGAEFERFFNLVLTDSEFSHELLFDGFGALERHGFDTSKVTPETRANVARLAGRNFMRPGINGGGGYACGTCGVCGLCGLCGEIDLGSASAALWATFALAQTEVVT